MDNIISRFPGLAEKIFDRLDNESLVNSRTVSRPWAEFTENEMFFLRRIIKKLIGGYENFQETWKLVMKKADMEMMNELALAVKFFYHNTLEIVMMKIANIGLCHDLHFTLPQMLARWLFVSLS